MSEPKEKKGLYFGWIVVFAGFLSMSLCFAPGINLAGLFVSPIAEDFGITRTAVAANITIYIFSSMLTSMVSGKILSKYSIRVIVPVVSAVIGLCYVGAAFSQSLLIIYILASIRGICGSFGVLIPISILINNWFGKKLRGKAMGLAMVGSGVGAIVLSPITGAIISNYGWRTAYLFFAALMLVVIPVTLFAYVRTPEEKGLKRIGEDESELSAAQTGAPLEGLTTSQAVKTPMFWLAAVSILMLAASSQSYVNNSASFLGDLSFAAGTVATIVSINSAGVAVGKLIIGAVCDRWGAKTGVVMGAALMFTGYVLTLCAQIMPAIAIVGAIICGLGMASVTIIVPLVTGELFGNRSYGTLVGYMNTASSMGSSTVPLLVTMVYDATGSYYPAWTGLCVLLVVEVVVINIVFAMKKGVYAKLQSSAS